MADWAAAQAEVKRLVEQRLEALLPRPSECPGRLGEAMGYVLLAPAKRVRAIVTVLGCEHCGGERGDALTPAASLEMVHAASLVLDDLPAMDDARVRRGRPTCHLTFGEDTAILAAIALMNAGFAAIAAEANRDAAEKCELTAILARSIGPAGLTGGQELDLHGKRGSAAGVAEIERTHQLKTGALFAAAGEAGAVAAGADPATRQSMRRFGDHLGLAFQAFDDVLDVHAESHRIGKDVERDVGKSTVVALIGRSAAERRAREHVAAARAELLDCAAAGGSSLLIGYVDAMVAQLTAPLAASGSAPAH